MLLVTLDSQVSPAGLVDLAEFLDHNLNPLPRHAVAKVGWKDQRLYWQDSLSPLLYAVRA